MSEHRINRRAARRTIEHDIVAARVRPGRQVAIVNVSAVGALIETSHRLLPGTCVELHVETEERRTTVRGRVLRCAVSRLLPSSITYRGAIAFDRDLPWYSDDGGASGYSVHTSERRAATPFRADATPQVI